MTNSVHDDVISLDQKQLDVEPIECAQLSRRQIRSLIFHLLYAFESFDYQTSLGMIIDTFNRGFKLDIPQEGEIADIVQAVVDARDDLDTMLIPLLSNWRLDRLGVCTKLVLRLALWELNYTDTPSTIVINEAIELAKCFSEKDAYRFVNGILDEFSKQRDKE